MKKWYQSKTIWFNSIMTLVDTAAFLEAVPGLPEWLPVVALLVHGIGNIILRVWFTSEPIK